MRAIHPSERGFDAPIFVSIEEACRCYCVGSGNSSSSSPTTDQRATATDDAFAATSGAKAARDQARVVLFGNVSGGGGNSQTVSKSPTATPADNGGPTTATSGSAQSYTEEGGVSLTNSTVNFTGGTSEAQLDKILQGVTGPLDSVIQGTTSLAKSLAASAATGGASWYTNPAVILAGGVAALLLLPKFWKN